MATVVDVSVVSVPYYLTLGHVKQQLLTKNKVPNIWPNMCAV